MCYSDHQLIRTVEMGGDDFFDGRKFLNQGFENTVNTPLLLLSRFDFHQNYISGHFEFLCK